jgi:hypothetical protein
MEEMVCLSTTTDADKTRCKIATFVLEKREANAGFDFTLHHAN